MVSTSFFTDGGVYDTAVVTSNDSTAPTAPSQAPSSFYPDGNIYEALSGADAQVVEMQALAAQTASDATSAASAASAAAASAAAAAASAGSAGTATPLVDGTAAVGASTKWAHEDHVHPTDTSRASVTALALKADKTYVDTQDALRAPLASPALTGTPTAPTASVGTNTTQLATTAFVLANAGSGGGTAGNPTAQVGLTAINGAATSYMRSDAAPALNVAITPTWTGAHKYGTATALSSNYNILSARANTGFANVHGFAENSTYNLGATGLGVCAYDAISTFTGTQTYDHTVSFQSRPTYGSSGTITNLYGSWDQPTVNTGTATNRYGVYVADAIGTGSVTNNYGHYVDSLTKGGTLNYAYYSAGTTPSKFGGNVDVGGLSVAGVDASGAWTSYTPSIGAGTGALGTGNSSSGRYKQIGKTVFFTAQVNLGASGAGTAGGWLVIGLPVAAKQTTAPGIAFSGIRSGLVGLTAIIDTTTTIDVVDAAAGANPIANSRSYYINGSYEAA
jgi:hypothetical protein